MRNRDFYNNGNIVPALGDRVNIMDASKFAYQAYGYSGTVTDVREDSLHKYIEVQWDARDGKKGILDVYPIRDLNLLSRNFSDNEEALSLLLLFDLIT